MKIAPDAGSMIRKRVRRSCKSIVTVQQNVLPCPSPATYSNVLFRFLEHLELAYICEKPGEITDYGHGNILED
jgi:hypothetical protein